MSCGIYKITNLINNLIYVGQSVSIEQRFANHRSRKNGNYRGSLIDQKIEELGVDKFSFEIIEECSIEELDEKEIYWINYYDSYNTGYNQTAGGSSCIGKSNPRALLTENDVFEIRQMYNNHIPFKEAYAHFSERISKRGFQKVWRYETWLHVCPEVYTDENRRWHATEAKKHLDGNKSLGFNNTERACSEEEIEKMRELRAQGLSYNKIGQIIGRAGSTIRKNCLKTERKVQYGIQIKNIETGLVFHSYTEASKWCKCDKGTFRVHKDDSKHPIGTIPTTGEPAHWLWL